MIIYLSEIIIDKSVLYNHTQDICFSDGMADLNNDIRLAIDSGKAAIGINRAPKPYCQARPRW